MFITKEQREELKDWLTIIALALAGVWSILIFAWEQRLKVYFEQSHLRVTVRLEQTADETQRLFKHGVPVLIHVTVENPSKRQVRVVSGQVEVHGDTLRPRPSASASASASASSPAFTPENIAAALDRDKASLSRHWERSSSELVYSSSAFHSWVFEPGEKHDLSRIVWIPHDKYDQLEVNVYVKSTPESDDSLCLKHAVDGDFNTSTLAGRLKEGKCEALEPGSGESGRVYDAIGVTDTTAFLPLAPRKSASAP